MSLITSEIQIVGGRTIISHDVSALSTSKVPFIGNLQVQLNHGQPGERSYISLDAYATPVGITSDGNDALRQSTAEDVRRRGVQKVIGAVFTCSACSQRDLCARYKPSNVRVSLDEPGYDTGTAHIMTDAGLDPAQADCLRVVEDEPTDPRIISTLSRLRVETGYSSHLVPQGVRANKPTSYVQATIEGGVVIEYTRYQPNGEGTINAESTAGYTKRVTTHLPAGHTETSLPLLIDVGTAAIFDRTTCATCLENEHCNQLTKSKVFISFGKRGQKRLQDARVWISHAKTTAEFDPKLASCLEVPTQSPQ